MKVLYYDCFSGISGDMNLGAMLDLGVSREVLVSGLQKLNISGWRLEISSDQRHGISGTKVTVITDDASSLANDDDHNHDHYHHDHTNHPHDHGTSHHHSHDLSHRKTDNVQRNLDDIVKIIRNSALPENITELSVKIFTIIAEAEAAVHDKPVNEIHFHEVGAVDSIIDIVGSAICFTALGVDKIYVNTIELGSGMVKCDHGLFPVPAPATARIIRGFPVHTGGVDFEATTPTGAAIIAAVATPAPEGLKFTIETSGYGIGQKNNPSRPNILRVFLADTDEETSSGHQAVIVECNVDDMNPELCEYVSQKLFNCGARDVFFTPVIMKKGRPAFTISVICEEENIDSIREVLFSESTTIGLRIFHFTKETLQREFEEIDTRFGKVVIKKSFYNGRLVSAKPEADRCAVIAAETGIPMKQVLNEIIALITK
ncbi:MAG: nickel pincer cofactor biosynthesis protein LarC [Bacteroidales bacterium]|nr:nickel pincer cofactor biosynthesis protein LarC [Bacteroidales bacterium]